MNNSYFDEQTFLKMMQNMGISCYQVGKNFDKIFAEEGAGFEVSGNMCHTVICMENPTEAEIKAVESGNMSVSLAVIDGIIFVSLNANNVLSFTMPFNMRLYEEFPFNTNRSANYSMPVILVDKTTNIIKAIRVIGFGKKFSQTLFSMCMKQWNEGVPDFESKLENIMEKYSNQEIYEMSTAHFVTLNGKIYVKTNETGGNTNA